MNLKEHYKNYLMKSVMESVWADQHGEFGPTRQRRYAGGGNWEPVIPRSFEGRRVSEIIAGRDPNVISGLDWRKPAKQDRPDFSIGAWDRRAAEEEAAAMAEQTRVRNLLNAAHHYSRNFGISLKPEHIQGIDFSTGSLDDHIDQISARLPPIR